MKKYCKKICVVLILLVSICSCKTEDELAEFNQSEFLTSLLQKLEFANSKQKNVIKENEPFEEKITTVPPGKVTEITANNLDGAVALAWKDPLDSDLFGIEISVSNNEEQKGESRSILPVAQNCIIFPPGTQYAEFSNLINDVQYTFAFTSINTNGERSASATKRITPKLIAKSPLVIKVFKSTEEITNSPIDVKIEVESLSPVKTIKYGTGERKADYFTYGGTKIIDSKSFTVMENGTFTIFAQDYDGRREVIEVTINNISQSEEKSENDQESTDIIQETEEIPEEFKSIQTGDLIYCDGNVEGIVFGKTENGIPLCVSVHEVQNLQWAVENSFGALTKINAIMTKITNPNDFANIEFTGDTDGTDNFNEITALSINDELFSVEDYPIFAFAENFEDSWYVPTAKELFELYSEREIVNAALKELNKEPLLENGHWWTSSQGANKDTAFYLNLDSNRFSDGKKTIPRKCCLIKKLKANYNSTQP